MGLAMGKFKSESIVNTARENKIIKEILSFLKINNVFPLA